MFLIRGVAEGTENDHCPGPARPRCHLSSSPLPSASSLPSPARAPGTTLHWRSSLMVYINKRRKRYLSLSAPNPWPVSWESNFQLKSSMANSRGFSASCSLAARLASRALSAGIIFDSLLSFTLLIFHFIYWLGCPSVLPFGVPGVSTASFITLL